LLPSCGAGIGGTVAIIVITMTVLLVLIYVRKLFQKKSSPAMAGTISDSECILNVILVTIYAP